MPDKPDALRLSNRGTKTVAGTKIDLLVRRFSKATYPMASEPWPEGDQ